VAILVSTGKRKLYKKKEMKAILEFNLPEDKEEFDVASRGMDWCCSHCST
jgi:hypothetical protein